MRMPKLQDFECEGCALVFEHGEERVLHQVAGDTQKKQARQESGYEVDTFRLQAAVIR